MHKNVYTAKTLIGNWQEERCSEGFKNANEISNCYLANPSHHKYVPISKAIGNDTEYKRVSSKLTPRNPAKLPPRTG